jgi:hypothetical protein
MELCERVCEDLGLPILNKSYQLYVPVHGAENILYFAIHDAENTECMAHCSFMGHMSVCYLFFICVYV